MRQNKKEEHRHPARSSNSLPTLEAPTRSTRATSPPIHQRKSTKDREVPTNARIPRRSFIEACRVYEIKKTPVEALNCTAHSLSSRRAPLPSGHAGTSPLFLRWILRDLSCKQLYIHLQPSPAISALLSHCCHLLRLHTCHRVPVHRHGSSPDGVVINEAFAIHPVLGAA